MAKIIRKETLAPGNLLIEIRDKNITARAKAGQFVILKTDERGERIPLSLGEINTSKGTITIVYQIVGKTTEKLSKIGAGDDIKDLIGPLGKPSEIKKYGRVICVGGGIGVAPLYPLAQALKEAGNYVSVIEGAKNKDYLIFEDKFLAVTDELHISTDDGSKGRAGFVTEALQEILQKAKFDLVFTIGPPVMMRAVCQVTKEFEIPTIVSLNPIMVDGTGMCGSCRVCVKGETLFGCVDGPEFDGHQVDWDLLISRQKMYLEEEKIAKEK
ncbi:MAG: sulfide/dihydroorotate dehydrogenase-like FAD/NAD-binding protein [Actinomycetia bacterium]|nr:sulfide/dihydroorotate dehydrogenase-like FAD/NAD-binding protein [Actinomycetes bacterium]